MAPNQAPSSVSVNGWNQTLHLTTPHCRGGFRFRHVLCLAFSPGLPCMVLQGLTAQGHLPREPGELHSSPLSAPQVAFTQSKQHLLVCSKVQFGQPPGPRPIHIPSSLLCPLSPAVPSLKQDPRAACTGRPGGRQQLLRSPGAFPLLSNAESGLSKLLCRH